MGLAYPANLLLDNDIHLYFHVVIKIQISHPLTQQSQAYFVTFQVG